MDLSPGNEDDRKIRLSYTLENLAFWGMEVQLTGTWDIVSIQYNWLEHCAHWGHRAGIAIAGLEFQETFADSRHWDYDKNVPEIQEGGEYDVGLEDHSSEHHDGVRINGRSR